MEPQPPIAAHVKVNPQIFKYVSGPFRHAKHTTTKRDFTGRFDVTRRGVKSSGRCTQASRRVRPS